MAKAGGEVVVGLGVVTWPVLRSIIGPRSFGLILLAYSAYQLIDALRYPGYHNPDTWCLWLAAGDDVPAGDDLLLVALGWWWLDDAAATRGEVDGHGAAGDGGHRGGGKCTVQRGAGHGGEGGAAGRSGVGGLESEEEAE